RMRVVDRITRCSATNVDPETGQTDNNIPQTLRRGFGHCDCGVFLEILDEGTLTQSADVVIDKQ
ncbi:MAG: MOSC domain-containing protein, partial [Pseudomonadota bacterium]